MRSAITLDDIRPCFEGAIPAVMATCDADGIPNVAYLSQVDYVDAHHLALSFQFFNTTRRNVLANAQVEIIVAHPWTGALYRIQARYVHTETSGALFERMKARLSGIASHTGMSEVFVLRGADLYRAESVTHVPKADLPMPQGGKSRLSALRRCSERLAACADLESLFETTLDCLHDEFDIGHAMLLMSDTPGERLFTVASRGYSASGVGSTTYAARASSKSMMSALLPRASTPFLSQRTGMTSTVPPSSTVAWPKSSSTWPVVIVQEWPT